MRNNPDDIANQFINFIKKGELLKWPNLNRRVLKRRFIKLH